MKKTIKILFLLSLSLVLFSCGSTQVETAEETKNEVKAPEKKNAQNEEYLRSIGNLETDETVTVEEFEADKAEILRIIKELEPIMETGDKTKWLTYIDPASVEYYSNTTILRKVREKLPNKQIQLHGIGDYFKYVFIPARKGRNVDEIRYISKTNIRAVQVREDKTDVVFYYFVKKDGKWYVHIPTLDEQK